MRVRRAAYRSTAVLLTAALVGVVAASVSPRSAKFCPPPPVAADCRKVLQAQSNEFLSWHFTVPFLRQDVGSCPLSEQGAEHTFLPSTVAPSWADVAGRKGVLSNNTNSSPTARDTAPPAHLPSSYNYTGGACRREGGQGSLWRRAKGRSS